MKKMKILMWTKKLYQINYFPMYTNRIKICINSSRLEVKNIIIKILKFYKKVISKTHKGNHLKVKIKIY